MQMAKGLRLTLNGRKSINHRPLFFHQSPSFALRSPQPSFSHIASHFASTKFSYCTKTPKNTFSPDAANTISTQTPPSPPPENASFNFKELLNVLKNGFYKLLEDRIKYPEIKKKENKTWDEYHFVTQHEQNMWKVIPSSCLLLYFTVIPFSLLTLPLVLVYGLPYVPTVFLTPYFKKKLYLSVAIELKNSANIELLNQFENKDQIFNFLKSKPFFTITEIDQLITDADKQNPQIRSSILSFYSNLEEEKVLEEDQLLAKKRDGLLDEELIVVCSNRKLYFKTKDNERHSQQQLAVLLGQWISSTNNQSSIPLSTLSYPLFLASSSLLSVPEKLPTNLHYPCLKIRSSPEPFLPSTPLVVTPDEEINESPNENNQK